MAQQTLLQALPLAARGQRACLDEHAVGADAGLARVAEGGGHDAAGRGVDVRVVEHNVGRIAALAPQKSS